MSSLSSTIPHLVSTLSSSLTSSSASEVNSALACFVSYLNAGQLSHTELTTLYPLLLPPLSNPSTVIAACSAVEELVERSAGLSQNISGSSSATRFVNRLRTTELITSWATGPYVSSVLAAAISDARDGSEPDDETLAVFKLATTLADHFISTFLFDPPPASSSSSSSAATDPSSLLTLRHPAVHALFSLLIELSGFPGHSAESYAVNELPQGAWLNLQELGADEGFVAGSGDGREGRAGKEDEWNVYRGVWEALAGKVRERATRPPDEEVRGWPKGASAARCDSSSIGRELTATRANADVRDAFRVYRSTTLSDSAQYAFFVLRESMIGSLVQLAAEQIAQPTHAGSDSHEDLEATLFVLYSLGEVVPLSPSLAELDPAAPPTPLSTYLSTLFGPSILGRLPSAPGSFPSLRSTALRLVGAYAPWFSAHADACLQAVSFVVAGLQEPELVPGAARALRGLCDANRKVLVPHVASFVQVLGGLEGTIDDSELVKVLESVASVVQALPENEVVEPLLVRPCAPRPCRGNAQVLTRHARRSWRTRPLPSLLRPCRACRRSVTPPRQTARHRAHLPFPAVAGRGARSRAAAALVPHGTLSWPFRPRGRPRRPGRKCRRLAARARLGDAHPVRPARRRHACAARRRGRERCAFLGRRHGGCRRAVGVHPRLDERRRPLPSGARLARAPRAREQRAADRAQLGVARDRGAVARAAGTESE